MKTEALYEFNQREHAKDKGKKPLRSHSLGYFIKETKHTLFTAPSASLSTSQEPPTAP